MTASPEFSNTDARLAQVLRRDKNADGQFVYAVITTGVYCLPSCPSRPARPENLRFFDNPAAARQAGFRACRRCHPDQPDWHMQRLASLCRILEQDGPAPPLDELAA
ncbi:MAG: Ada metal-binding domain-containing protein, partial [Alcanivorax sp.]|nr:Ada metal-binding domain-containing protein [Alcanivorax sp.]